MATNLEHKQKVKGMLGLEYVLFLPKHDLENAGLLA